jgi:hypothetical protein
VSSTAQPAAPNAVEDEHDGDYDYGSCQSPWRLATHYLVTGDVRAKTALSKINAWIRGKTGNDPTKIVDGYKLNGTAYGEGASYAFEAPIGVAAMIDSANQSWLDSIWNHMKTGRTEGFAEDTTKMLAMIVMSGNWWEP